MIDMRMVKMGFRASRWPNLIMLTFSMVLLYNVGEHEILSYYPLQVLLPDWVFISIILLVLTAAAAGYLINDTFDVLADEANGKVSLPIEMIRPIRLVAAGLSLVSLSLCIVVSISTGLPGMVLIGLFLVIGVWLYTPFLKGIPLVGNILTASLVSLGMLLPILAASIFALNQGFLIDLEIRHFLWRIMIGYGFFAFVLTLTRELVKDLEDARGDILAGYRTFPVAYGRKNAVVFTTFMMAVNLLILMVILVFAWIQHYIALSVYGFITLILPLAIIMIRLPKAKTSKEYGRIALGLKGVMMGGILAMFFLH